MTKTHIIEQREDGICFPVTQIFLVRQTQPSADYFHETIHVFTDEEDARDKARELNKEYGSGCKFTDEGDFEWVLDDSTREYEQDDIHYYDVEKMKINK